MQKFLIYSGVILVVAGLLWPWLSKLPFGHLPGDIIIDRPNMKIYIPIATMIIISIVLSVILWILKKIS